MKQRITLIALLLSLLHMNAFAQDAKSKKVTVTPLILEDDLRDITVSDNIDLILMHSSPENVNVRVPEDAVDKIKVRFDDRGIVLSTTKNLAKGERIMVYANVNELENLTLKGNSFVMSRGVLNSRQLQINIGKGGRASLKSKGKVLVNTDGKYQISKEDQDYSSVFAME